MEGKGDFREVRVRTVRRNVFNCLMSKISHLKYFPIFGGNVSGILMEN